MKSTKLGRFVYASIASVALLLGGNASASVIVASGDTNLDHGGGQLATFYSNMFSGSDVFATGGWSTGNTSAYMSAAAASFSSGVLSVSALAGKEWFVASTNTAYSAGELSIIANFVSAGGNLFVMGEHAASYSAMNAIANAVLAAVGSSMTVGFPVSSETVWQASGGNIGVDALTAGISLFSGNYAGTVNGGTALFTANSSGEVVLAVERLNQQVPEPTALALLSLGLLGLAGLRRKA